MRNEYSVRVPGSTSNLGSGFDVLGLALSLFLDVSTTDEPRDEHTLIECEGNARDWPRDGSNLLFRAHDLARERLGLPPRPRAFRVNSGLPLSRGLGSSAAAAAAGLLLGSHAADEQPDRGTLAAWAVELEGHPDNACPSLFGGLVAALTGTNGLLPTSLPVHPELHFCVAFSPQQLRTSDARRALPGKVPHALAVRQSRRLLALIEGLRTADDELLDAGAADELHVPYRLPLIDGGREALNAAREAGAKLATISGSGPTLFAIAGAERIAGVAEALRSELTRHCGTAVAEVVEVVTEAPRVTVNRCE